MTDQFPPVPPQHPQGQPADVSPAAGREMPGFETQPGFHVTQPGTQPPVGFPAGQGAPVQPGASVQPGAPVQPGASLPSSASSGSKTMDLSDGEWHRMHPITPLLQGGLVLIVVLGYLLANLRDRVIGFFIPSEFRDYATEYGGDPIEWVAANNLMIWLIVAVVVVLAVIVTIMWLMWRFHAVRVTEGAVEVRKGIIFRSQRRAPLDRIQGVNLTRPFVARLIGLAKLEVVGAGTDANVQLEYLSTANAERVRADILRWASGARRARSGEAPVAAAPQSRVDGLVQNVSEGVTGLVMGAEAPVAEPASVVNIPLGRLIASHLISNGTPLVLLFGGILTVAIVSGTPAILFAMIPASIGIGAFFISTFTKTLRYSIAPTDDGVRVVFGLTTTITETIPPGRIHALQVSQSFIWRWFGWYHITINRMSGRSAQQQQKDPFTTLLPVGTAEDVARVIALVYPDVSAADMDAIIRNGLNGPADDDGYIRAPKRSWWVHLWGTRRAGILRGHRFVLLRRGVMWRRLGIFPLERVQSLSLSQGPLLRAARLSNMQLDLIPGQVSGTMYGMNRDDILPLFADIERAAVTAGAEDHSHRWGEHNQEAV